MPGKKRSRKPSRDGKWYAAQRRRQSHDQAQAHAEQQQLADVPDHPLICADDPQLIADNDALADLIAHVRDVGSFAYDTEFIGELSYFPQLCLVQIATPQRLALVDPFGDVDLTGVWELLADPSVETIVHAGTQDLEPVLRHLDKQPANIFDTQIAAGFVGMGYPTGLGKLVEALLGVAIGKGLTYTAWDRRPLSPVHQRYAADDVRYLPALKSVIEQRATEAGHVDWLHTECATLCERSLYEPNPLAVLTRMRSVANLSGRKQRVAAALVAFRDATARDFDAPPRSVMGDDVIAALARKPPKSIDQLPNIRNLQRKLADTHGEAIMQAIEQGGSEGGAPLVEPKPDESTVQRLAIDALWAAVSSYCLGRGVEPQLVGSRQQLAAYYLASLNGGPPADSPLVEGWRGELVGDVLQSFLDGKVQLQLQWSDQQLRSSAVEPEA